MTSEGHPPRRFRGAIDRGSDASPERRDSGIRGHEHSIEQLPLPTPIGRPRNVARIR